MEPHRAWHRHMKKPHAAAAYDGARRPMKQAPYDGARPPRSRRHAVMRRCRAVVVREKRSPGTLRAMQDESTRGPVAYLARPHRPALVARTLDELRGPVRGIVELPQRLMWNPQRRFDLDNHD